MLANTCFERHDISTNPILFNQRSWSLRIAIWNLWSTAPFAIWITRAFIKGKLWTVCIPWCDRFSFHLAISCCNNSNWNRLLIRNWSNILAQDICLTRILSHKCITCCFVYCGYSFARIRWKWLSPKARRWWTWGGRLSSTRCFIC